jgi:hypothetical protein
MLAFSSIDLVSTYYSNRSFSLKVKTRPELTLARDSFSTGTFHFRQITWEHRHGVIYSGCFSVSKCFRLKETNFV